MSTCDELEEINGDIEAEVRRDYQLARSHDCSLHIFCEGWLERHGCDHSIIFFCMFWEGLKRERLNCISPEG